MGEGFKDISLAFLTNLKWSAKRRNVYYNVTPEYLWNKFIEQNRRCCYSGELIYFHVGYTKTRGKILDQTASLDRIDSSIGYVEGNVQWVHKDINNMKMALSQDRFLELCKKVSSMEIGL